MTQTPVTQTSLVGRVKWFNSSSGFGFITLSSVDSVEGVNTGDDIFVHHSSIKVASDQYRYLVQGEYVEFTITPTTQGPHKFQAINVCGINGGKLMCETRRDLKMERSTYYESKQTTNSSPTRRKTAEHTSRTQSKPKARGEGPREGGEWSYIVKSRRPNAEASVDPNNKPESKKQPSVKSSRVKKVVQEKV